MLQFMADAVCNIMAKENFDWRDVEAILFCFYSIVESCEPDGDFIRKVSITSYKSNILDIHKHSHVKKLLIIVKVRLHLRFRI